MIIVNPVYIHELLSPLIGGADSEESLEIYGHYRSDMEGDVKELAECVLFPEFKKQKPILQQAVKDTFAYYLVHPQKINFESIFNSLLLPISTPRNSRLFFQWIWEVFFNGEFTDYITREIIVEDFDVNAPLYLLSGTGDFNAPLN